MENKAIAEQFKLLAQVMDIHGENTFKVRSYTNAAFQLDKHPAPLARMDVRDIASIKGIGEAMAAKVQVLLQTGQLPALQDYLSRTPQGVIDMLRIKGLGPKKIAVVWKEMGIEELAELLYACQENRLLLYKGFGAKTQDNVRESIEFFLASRGQHLYADLESYAQELIARWQQRWGPETPVALTGGMRRQCPVLDRVSIVVGQGAGEIRAGLEGGYVLLEESNDRLLLRSPEQVMLEVFPCSPEAFAEVLFRTTGSEAFLSAFEARPLAEARNGETIPLTTDAAILEQAGLPYIPPCLREDARILDQAEKGPLPALIQPEDIRGVIHTHSDWSDGRNSVLDMAEAARALGYEYLVLSDHSQSAAYARGLKPDRIVEQHQLIDELNRQLAPFRIFKSIESDILYDGSLDYPDEILRSFDLVIASVHSNLKMDQDKAMQRLLRAIAHPCTTILGHPTGRLLLGRPGYPVDHRALIDACVAHGVVIEINAHPRRLDLDWSWLPYALEQGALLSIDPDAHARETMADIRYGVLAAQKGGLTADRNLSSFSLPALEAYLQKRRAPAAP